LNQPDYVLGHSDHELGRLRRQAVLLDSITREYLATAGLAVSAGANVKALQRMLGHAKASMTLDVYADLFDDDLDSVAESLDTAIVKASSAAIAAASGGSPAPPLLPQGVSDC
jgi:integrase